MSRLRRPGRHRLAAVPVGRRSSANFQHKPHQRDKPQIMDARTVHYLARNPRALLNYQRTGKLPDMRVPTSPLITLIDTIPRRYHGLIRNVTIGPTLGYSRRWHHVTLAHALRWLRPDSPTPIDSVASERFRIKGYQKSLTIQDLAACCGYVPAILLDR